jgi:alkylation response protein AidB-like acyl-CoA dehydrogenase
MDFTLTDEQRLMTSALRELTDDICSSAQLRAAFEGKSDSARERWARISDMGLPGIIAPRDCGGSSLELIDAVLIAEEAGRAALPEPLSEHAGVAVPLLADCAAAAAAAAALLPRAASGECLIGVVHEANPCALIAEPTSHLVVCRGDEVHLVPIADAHLTLEPSIDALRRLATVGATIGTGSVIAAGAAGRTAAGRAFERGAVLTAAECLGLAERLIRIAVAYALERTQFGKPIGSYQALKHALASAQVKLEFARPVVYAAAARQGELTSRAKVLASHAKLAASDAAELAARTAIQVHGAMGYSWEVNLHFYMKRAWALAGAWGDHNFHARRLQSMLLDGAIELGADRTFDS